MRRRWTILVVALAASALTACVGDSGEPEATSGSPSVDGRRSRTETLHLAEDALAAYLSASDEAMRGDATNADELRRLVTQKRARYEESALKSVKESVSSMQGETSFADLSLQSVTDEEVVAYVCIDVSSVMVFDEAGVEVTPAGRADIFPMIVTWKPNPDSEPKLLLETFDVWSGRNFC